ncbi:MAG: amidohydrolase [Prolixibacteraceae bacterium]|nr:amidohydrolase [Prolixibacteraceae bacterium]
MMNPADIILLNGKVITVDGKFSITNALAIGGENIIATGTNDFVRNLEGNNTRVIDLKGRTVIPGIIEAHLHPEIAAVSELEEEIPHVQTIGELLAWIKSQAQTKSKGKWIIHPKFFPTRLRELRQPTLAELDEVAPDNPVFLNGTYGGMINSEAIRQSGISRNISHKGVIANEKTGLPTGFIKVSAFNLLNLPPGIKITIREREEALRKMFKLYNRYAITSVCFGFDDQESVTAYRNLRKDNRLTVRILQNILLPAIMSGITRQKVTDILNGFGVVSGDGDEWEKTGPLKIVMDGGILTGTAYLHEPWGDKIDGIFGVHDKSYRGVLNYSREELIAIVTAVSETGWGFTAHCTGGGSVDLLLEVFEEVDRQQSIKGKRFSVIHGNFFTERSLRKMKELEIYANVQPAWFYKDADAMRYFLGEDRISNFNPFRSLFDAGVMVNGSSDHMVKLDANTSINPYNPFLSMWSAITRTTERGSVIMPSEAITREEALRMYTANNAYLSFEETLKGTIEAGKLADIAVLSDDILTCSVDKIKDIESVMTIVGGEIVFDDSIV